MGSLKNIIMLVIFIISVFLTFIGHKAISYKGLVMMLLGLIGILTVLYLYNQTYAARDTNK